MAKKHKRHLQGKLVLGLIVVAVVLLAALTPALAKLYRYRMEKYYSNLAFAQASIAASI